MLSRKILDDADAAGCTRSRSSLKGEVRMKMKRILLVSLFAIGFAMSATAGGVADMDSDDVPDVFDNCIEHPNGPDDGNDQLDADWDGFGNSCDADYTQDGVVDGADFGFFVTTFSTVSSVTDHTGDGNVDGADWGIFIQLFNSFPGPSGLTCADATATDAPCEP